MNLRGACPCDKAVRAEQEIASAETLPRKVIITYSDTTTMFFTP